MSERESPWARGGSRPAPPARATARPARDEGTPHTTHAPRELRMYGVNAIDAVFKHRPGDIRKLWLAPGRVARFKPLLAWCARQRIGYRVVEDADLQKLAASSHHEGVVADVARAAVPAFTAWLHALPAGPACALWLDGVGNPHNLGAILRSCAHFGVAGVLVPGGGPALSGAAARVAEGGAEHVPLVPLGDADSGMAALQAAGFELVATVVDGGDDVFAMPLPPRTVLVMGAEGEGMDRTLAARCTRRVSIPGTGAVESLNVAAATAVLLAQWRCRR